MKNHPIAVAPVVNMIMLRNGRMIPLEQYARNGGRAPEVVPPRSRKEARARKKAVALSARRLVRHGAWR